MILYLTIFTIVCSVKCCSKRYLERIQDQEYNFSYAIGVTGPYNWPVIYSTCAGRKQSPINIDTSNLYLLKATPLEWNPAYSQIPKCMTLLNNGNELILHAYFHPHYQPTLSGGPLTTSCTFRYIKFHWGLNDNLGSEHTIDDVTYVMEMQLVHNCHSRGNSLVIVAYLFQITNEENCSLKKILEVFRRALRHPYRYIKLPHPFNIASLATPFTKSYATYMGSLTTPPCTQCIRWIVNPYPLFISRNQLEEFRMVDKYAPELRNNFRPIQSTNNRRIYFVS